MIHLIIFTIGPVQSFIAQARKAKDLLSGSQLLTDLTWEAMKVFGQQVVYPFVENSDYNPESLPNRFVAKVDASTEEVELLANTAEKNVRAYFLSESERLFKAQTGYSKSTPAFRAQIEDHLEIVWTYLPLPDVSRYKDIFIQLNQQLANIKNTRRFSQISYHPDEYGEAGRKCSVDGERNALFFGRNSSKYYINLNDGYELTKTTEITVEQNEGLSAVSFFKRFYQPEKQASVAEICLKHLKYSKEGYTHNAFSEYERLVKENLGKDGYDEQFCFEENLTQEILKDKYYEIRVRFEHLIQPVVGKGSTKNRHYAVLRFDGDDMGKWISGKYLPNGDLMDFQQKISQFLGEFAVYARTQIITNNKGTTIYAGGDDFIGMVNLNYLFEVLSELRVVFKTMVNDRLRAAFPVLNKNFTFSAGIAIAHYKTPLNIVLKQAKQAEEMAKDAFAGKNAFSIVRLKQSGERQSFAAEFGEVSLNPDGNSGQVANISYIETILHHFKESFSTAFIRNYQREFMLVGDDFRTLQDVMTNTELKRLILRSANTNEKKNEKADNLIEAFEPFEKKADFFDFLHIMDFIHRQTAK